MRDRSDASSHAPAESPHTADKTSSCSSALSRWLSGRCAHLPFEARGAVRRGAARRTGGG